MNDISLLMSRIEEINRITDPRQITDDNITDLIAFHRRARARRAAGLKDDRPTTTAPVNLSALLNLPTSKPTAPIPQITRRI